jgi:alanyl-tRNA synthetase
MKASELRQSFLTFFEERGHTVVPSSSLIPDDPSVLLTTAGMQQFKPYFVGRADPMRDFHSKNTASVQKSFRTSDIDEVGDETHNTFFEMLGNFSFGGYFKKEAITSAYEYLKEIGLTIDYVTIFKGDEAIPRDEESARIWRELDVSDIREYGREENFWGPTGAEGPCGPSTEIYLKDVEVWNLVFNEYYCKPDGSFEPLKTPGVDTGMGLERLAVAAQVKKHIFETDLFAPLITALPDALDERGKRIVVDHCRGIAFLLSDGVRPSNKEAGYILRRLMRRAIVTLYAALEGSEKDNGRAQTELTEVLNKLFDVIVAEYGDFYHQLNANVMKEECAAELSKFMGTLRRGLKELERLHAIDAKVAFRLYESFGLPFEVIKEMGGENAAKLIRESFEEEFEKHREKSRAGRETKFGGHGLVLDTGELKARSDEEVVQVTKLHTATHLLQAALRAVLGEGVHQAGSDVTAERTRFDFTFDRRLTDKEIQQIEEWVNERIKKNLTVTCVEMPYEEAVKSGALFFSKEKYPATVKVYSVGEKEGTLASKELCGGPHVEHTGDMGHFRIRKQEAVGAGVRRVRGVLG